ncbi:MAG: hypothetical protein HY318_06535 [Armatimonadetes bacterium]|nr:hypothetical protein [Armatimonadota bacterium]
MSQALPQAEVEKLSKVLLEDLMVSVLLRDRRPLRTPELAQGSSNGVTLSREFIREALTGSERIVFANRKWNLSHRLHAIQRPVEGLIEDTLRIVGRPIDLESLAEELTALRGRSRRYYSDVLARILEERPKYVEIHGEVYILQDWLLEISSNDEQQVVIENFLNKDPEFPALSSQFASRRLTGSGTAPDWLVKVIESAGKPVHHRILSFLLWKELRRQFDPTEVWRALYDDERLRILSTGHCLTAQMEGELKDEVARKSSQVQETSVEDQSVDVAALLKKKLPKSQAIVLPEEDLGEVETFLRETGRPVTLTQVMSDLFELSPAEAEYAGTIQSLSSLLGADQKYKAVGTHRYHLKELIPEHIQEVPEVLNVERISVRTIDDEEVDVLLEDNGLDGDLADAVTAAEWEEIDEEVDVARVPKTKKSRDFVRYAVPYHHYLSGTMKYRELDDEFFGMESGIMYGDFIDETNSLLSIWICEDTGLLYGLGEWYKQNLEPCGSVIYIQPTDRPCAFQLVNKREKDAALYVAPDRIEELLAMRLEAASKPMSVFDIMSQIMTHHGRGLEFITLWAEVNIVRRTSKRMVASNLSGYHCFYQPSGKSGTFFTFDERRLDQGFNGKKRRYIKKDDMM